MKSTHLIFLSLATAAVRLDIEKVYNHKSLSKRGTDTEDLDGDGLSFLAYIEAGTPFQKQQVLIDTGSSDLWLPTPNVCNTNADGVAPANTWPIDCRYTYDPSKSTSMANSTNAFSIGYGDGSTSSGYYIQDTIQIGSATLEAANFAYADQTTASAVFGIGFQLGEACTRFVLDANDTISLRNTSCTPYSNVPIQMKEQGIISSTAYSIWLNDLSSHYGNILFGGVDHAKYLDKLVKLPVEDEPGLYYKDGTPTPFYPEYTRILVTLNQVNLFPGGGASDILMEGAVPVLLDTGSTECSWPSAMVDSLAKTLNAKPDGYGGYFVDCGVSDDAYIGFDFRGLEIEVPLRQFLRPLHDYNSDEMQDAESKVLYCSIGASPSDSDTFFILGDNVLSSFYAVYDLENKEIALAPALYNQDETDVEDISDSIPSAVEAPAYSTSFSLTFDVNTAPTVTFGLTPITTITGDPATIEPVSGLTNTANGEAHNTMQVAKHLGYAVKGGAAGIAADSASASDGNGITDIEGFSISRTLAEGLNTVYTAGAPSTLSTSASTTTTSANSTSAPTTSSTPTASTPTSTGTISSTTSTTAGSNISTPAIASSTSTPSTTASTIATTSSADAAPIVSSSTSSSSSDVAVTVTSEVTAFTTYCPGPTTFTYGGSAYTVTEATTLTVTSCPGDADTSEVAVTTAPGPVKPNLDTTVTSDVTILTTYCPEATTLSYGGSVYTITEATTLIVTSCPPESTSESSGPATPIVHTSATATSETSMPAGTPEAPESESTSNTPPSETIMSSTPVPTSNSASTSETTAVTLVASSSSPAVSEVPEVSTSEGVVVSNGASKLGFWLSGILALVAFV